MVILQKMEPEKNVEWRLLIIGTLLGILIRLLLLVQYAQTNPFFLHPVLDSAVYLDWAESILQGKDYFESEYHHPPLYAFFLAAILKISSGNVFAILFFQSFMIALQAWMIFYCTRELFGVPAAWVVFALYSLCGPVVFYSMKVLSETLYSTFLLASFLMLLRYRKTLNLKFLFGSGLLLGCAFELRGNALICMLPLLFVAAKQNAGRMKGIAVSILIAGFVLPVVPVIYRNYTKAKVFSAGGANWGENFYFANNPTATGSFSSMPGISPNLSDQIQEMQKIASSRVGRPLSSLEAQNYWMREGERFIRDHTLIWLKLEANKLHRLFTRTETSSMYFYGLETKHMQPALRLLFVSYGLIVPLFFLGIIGIRDLRKSGIVFAWILAQLILLLIFWPELRFLMPVFPFLLMIAGNVVYLSKMHLTLSKNLVSAAGIFIWMIANAIPIAGTGGKEAWYANVSSAYYAEGEYEKAEKMARKSIEINPRYVQAWINVGAVFYANRRMPDARKAWEHALQLEPDNVTALKNLAVSYEGQDRRQALLYWNRTLQAARGSGVQPQQLTAIENRIRELQQ